jgi:hypothetical protein
MSDWVTKSIQSRWAYSWFCLLIGLGAAFFRIVNSFFGHAYITDVMVFALLAGVICYIRPRGAWLSILLLVLPVYLLLARTLVRLGLDQLNQGIGTGWATSVVLVLPAAVVGGVIGAKIGQRNGP